MNDQSVVVWKPVALVTLKNGEALFVPRDQADEIGEATRNGREPLINLGGRWVSRSDIIGINPDIQPEDAWAVVLQAPRNLRAKLRDFIRKNEESSGRTMTAQWAQGWLAQWIAEEEKKDQK